MNLKDKIYPGCHFGFSYPVIALSLNEKEVDPRVWGELHTCLNEIQNLHLPPLSDSPKLPEILRQLAIAILRGFAFGVYEDPRVTKADNQTALLFIPCHLIKATQVLSFLKACAVFLGTKLSDKQRTDHLEHFKKHSRKILASPFGASNTVRFLAAAHKLRVPFYVYEQDFVGYGLGKYLKRMRSSFTSNTTSNAASIARDKKFTGDLLRVAMLPGANLTPVANEDMAIKIAATLGVPVVLKPRSLDGGAGVYPNLIDPQEIKSAFQAIAKLGQKVVLEKYFAGRDFRFVIYKSKLIWAIEREYPGVWADGKRSICELVEAENLNRSREPEAKKVMVQLVFDDESITCLSKQNLTKESIPKSGTFVRLRDKSNVNTGGRPIAFPISRIHPENVELAERATDVIGLDLAGVDLLITDPAVSWRQAGALICEVNAQPSLGGITSLHLYEEILKSEMSAGSTPQIAIVPCSITVGRLTEIARLLGFSEKGLGVVSGGVAYLDGKALNSEPVLSYYAAVSLFQFKELEGIIISSEEDLLSTGLPHFSCDYLVLPDSCLASSEQNSKLRQMMNLFTAVRLIIEQNQLVSVGGDYCCGLRRLQGA